MLLAPFSTARCKFKPFLELSLLANSTVPSPEKFGLKPNVPSTFKVLPFSNLISLSLALAVNCTPEPISRVAFSLTVKFFFTSTLSSVPSVIVAFSLTTTSQSFEAIFSKFFPLVVASSLTKLISPLPVNVTSLTSSLATTVPSTFTFVLGAKFAFSTIRFYMF